MHASLERRRIRKYTGEKVSDALVEDLLRAAMAAPSGGNEQPWEFIVVRDKG
ncbi:MAG: nitroreductase family protein, partial [Clostridiales bacterium]|nr:nitroreductase family protein [Clostridiales bacterium]